MADARQQTSSLVINWVLRKPRCRVPAPNAGKEEGKVHTLALLRGQVEAHIQVAVRRVCHGGCGGSSVRVLG